ncbi:hypothetical protein K2D_13830 [Planctomycetes bacterium K2D]|uniref:Uncharacterized protein n=1 Tax=Botrimarina mediterranea TaxID=2528022 RepID=A0A518K647_9BACT|nr:hypothetical protein Spa11_14570 [Botrimarina mediterranea]QDV77778.1 hypothetical protein K2D_13830 [Planctomycetes bacterium K2D]
MPLRMDAEIGVWRPLPQKFEAYQQKRLRGCAKELRIRL